MQSSGFTAALQRTAAYLLTPPVSTLMLHNCVLCTYVICLPSHVQETPWGTPVFQSECSPRCTHRRTVGSSILAICLLSEPSFLVTQNVATDPRSTPLFSFNVSSGRRVNQQSCLRSGERATARIQPSSALRLAKFDGTAA